MVTGTADGRRRTALRLTVFSVAVSVCFAALCVSFWYIQVLHNQMYREMAEANTERRMALRAPRGILFDRSGRVLVENRDAYVISILREHSKNLDQTMQLLAAATGVAESRVRDTVARHMSTPRYQPIVVIEDASLAQVSAVLARRLDFELPGVVVQRVPTRRYPSGGLAAHLLGYVGEISEAQMASEGLRSGSMVGQSGVEKAYNKLLMGTDGERRVMVNNVGREITTLAEAPAAEGRRIQLTIDYDLQQAAEDAFRVSGYAGAAVVLDPRNGEVLALASVPSYDPNVFAAGIDPATWKRLNTDRLRPLQNRATQGRYSPGSTFKVVVATAALEEGIITPDFKVTCHGGATFFDRFFQCSVKSGHGTVDLRHAIEQSCNVYFYTVGNMVGIDKIHKWAEALGLTGKTGIDLPNEAESLVPSSAWKRAHTGERWYSGETISVAIGQGQVSVTPMSLALTYASVANGGTRLTPRLVRAVNDGSGWKTPPAADAVVGQVLKPETVAALHDGLFLVVNGAGTGGRARLVGYDVAGKTGTAQVISLQGGKQAAGRTDMDLRDHGWFAFFAPKDNPEVAGVVFAEHAGHGSNAAPLARHIIETYFAKKAGRPLPVLAPPEPPPIKAAAPGVAGQDRPH
ncbi:MAG: penicillin-binding protein 2 [Acidobacteria bacterium]|nr:penicillin-binding protein 2 [Acidobacteriota bacterium]